MDKPKKVPSTIAYNCFLNYRQTFFASSNIEAVMKEARNFVAGNQYVESSVQDMPKPVFNICREYTEKVVAKVLGTATSISFVSDTDTDTLKKLDSFYEYQMGEIDNEEYKARICRAGFIDGIGVGVTSFDEDTLGTKSLFRGFLKRQVIKFENLFVANPYIEDIQDQEYVGYIFLMPIGAIKNLLEGDKNSKEYKEKLKLIVPDDYFEHFDDDGTHPSIDNIDSKTATVVVRFFRIDGEVYFETCTQYADLYEHPHALNPKLNEKKAKEMREKFNEQVANQKTLENQNDKTVLDYDNTDTSKHTLFTKAKKQTNDNYLGEKRKFSRYPIEIFRPYPIPNSILGESGVAQVIPNQKNINLVFLLITLIIQNHGMPKYMAKQDALMGQEVTNDPSQILIDYSKARTNGGDWGFKRMSNGDAVNSELLNVGVNMLSTTRSIYGFDNLTSEQMANDVSGYAYQQMVKQANLTLEQPQKRLWDFEKNTARTDLMYFQHFIDEAKYTSTRTDGDIAVQERYREMLGNIERKPFPAVKKTNIHDVENGDFDHEFNISIEVSQGIAGSELTESQHYNQVWQYIAQGNVDADKIKLLVTNDPSFSRKTRQSLLASLEELEISQIQMKNAEIEKLKSVIMEAQQAIAQQQGTIDQLTNFTKARERAFKNKIDELGAVNQMQREKMEEGEAKSNNAKGVAGSDIG